jgi:hypothetical protein
MNGIRSASLDRISVLVGLNGGAHVEGLLPTRGSRRIVDVLNNRGEFSLALEGPDALPIILARPEVVWIGFATEGQPDQRSLEDGAHSLYDHDLRILAGPFELTGCIRSYRDVDWSDYLLARANSTGFFVMDQTTVHGPSNTFDMPSVAVNASRVAALMAQSSRPVSGALTH